MPRGFFTQSAFVLFRRAPAIDVVERALEFLGQTRRSPARSTGWLGGFDPPRPVLRLTPV